MKTLQQLYLEHKGKLSDKWTLYLSEWDRLFTPYRNQGIRLLEIGIQNGGSLEIWAAFFSKAQKIVGCDIDQKCEVLRYDDERIAVVVADANSDEGEGKILLQAPTFDIIIDDGSHNSSDVVHSFTRYFPHLSEEGFYVIEDLHASYWGHFEGGLNNPHSSMAFLKRLADIINHEHWRNNKSREMLLAGFESEFNTKFDELVLEQIHSIEFINSLCIIKKSPSHKNTLGQRITVGTEEQVTSDWKRFNNTSAQDILIEVKDDSTLDVFELIARNNSLTQTVSDQEQSVLDLTMQLEEKRQRIQDVTSVLENIQSNIGWKLIQRFRNFGYKISPMGSRSRKLLDLAFHFAGKTGTNSHRPTPLMVSTSPGEYAVCTISSKNYLSSVRVLAQSIQKTNPGVTVYALLVDRVDDIFDPTKEPFKVITLDELGNIPDPQRFKFKYMPLELNTAVKPYFMEYLFEKFNLKGICYFDPDIYVFHDLQRLWDLLSHHSIVLTPHITQPYEDDRKPSELEINLAGIFNLGFIGISDTPSSRSFLQWWKQRMYEYCFLLPSAGMHVDQNWVNFAPAMREGVFILRDTAYNIAYWNLHYRGERLQFLSDEKLLIGERPVLFYHFSGLDLNNLEKISIHQNRYTLSDLPNLRPLFQWYKNLLMKNGYEKTRKWKYAFEQFDNGVSISVFIRQLYNSLNTADFGKFGDPFSTREKTSFFAWLNEPVDNKDTQPTITRLHMEIHRLRKDLQAAFPDPLGADRPSFRDWLETGAIRDHSLDKSFIPTDNVKTSASRQIRPIKLLFSTRDFIGRSAQNIFKNNERIKNILKTVDQKIFGRSMQKPGLTSGNTADTPTPLPFGINLSGYIQGEFGIAEGSRASIQAMESARIPFVLNNIRASLHRDHDNTHETFSDKSPYRVNLMHVNADVIQEHLQQKGATHLHNRYNIAYWFWELSNFPEKWRRSFDSFHEIWVASTFCQESIAKVSPIPVVKMTFPIHIHDTQVVSDSEKFGLPKDKFLFLFSFDYLSIFERKNPLGVLHVFNSVFGGRADVLLVLKGINMEHAPEKAALLASEVNRPNIRLIHGHLNRRDMLTLIATCDSYISLHRSEGFGLGMAQAMYFGKPVIATGYSGNMEFMNHNNSFPVRYKLTELEQDYGPYEKGNVWAEPDLDHAAHLMQLIFQNTDDVRKVAEQAKFDIQTKMTPTITGREMLDRLKLQIK
jgi:glycosyltransferase involved in cell wall biosynthesis